MMTQSKLRKIKNPGKVLAGRIPGVNRTMTATNTRQRLLSLTPLSRTGQSEPTFDAPTGTRVDTTSGRPATVDRRVTNE